ncbi:MAG TPA: glycosyltransferase family 2 protein, partial [Chloroflexia bacterium]|nr:glycosyltransferase family 2 protein [Chloroflexia bacterium]
MSTETAVIVPNWNGARLLPECLSALSVQTYRDFTLWLVDNGSIDGSDALLDDLERTRRPEWLATPLPNPTQVIRNADNLGFAEANNQAMRPAIRTARYIVTLNNDAVPEPDFLERLIEAARQGEPSLGMVAATMLFAHRPEKVASAGISIHREGVALDRAVGLSTSRLETGGIRPVFGPSAGAALYRSDMLRDVGLFDSRFFSYLEDADLAWRARLRGWRAVHNPLAKVRHEYSATGGQNSPFKRRLISRNRIWLLYKNMPTPLFPANSIAMLRYELAVLLSSVVRGDRHLLRGRLEGLARLRELTRDRRKTISSARVHPSEVAEMLAPPLSVRQSLKYRKRLDNLLKPQSL